jgi:ABC-2 type transport system permease protein
MRPVLTLLRPRLRSLLIRKAKGRRDTSWLLKMLMLGGLGLAIWYGLFRIALKVLRYLSNISEIGDILSFKLLSMMLLTALALLVFSGILTALSRLYLSKDLILVHSLPVSRHQIFLARWIDSTADSSWMVIVYTLPVFLAYGVTFASGPFYYVTVLLAMLFLTLTASAISAAIVMLAVLLIPANRMKSIFILLGLAAFVFLYIAFRLLKPEQLVDPEVFKSVLAYIQALQTPSAPWLPSTWAFDAIRSALSGAIGECLKHLALAASGAGAFCLISTLLADLIYYDGFSKSQTAASRLIKSKALRRRPPRIISRPVYAFITKELKTFFRDQTQWTQLLLLSALVLIYIYNFSVLPLERSPIGTIYLQNLLAFLNMALALFVLTAITGRFAYPAVSLEGPAFWLVRSGPITFKQFLRIKFFIYYLPLLALTEILIIATNLLLDVRPFMMVLSTLTVFCLVPGIVSLGIGLGAAYPDFQAENPTQTITGFGGLVFMILCVGLIGAVTLLEAGPVYEIFMADIRGQSLSRSTWAIIIGSFGAALIISLTAIFVPLWFGEKRLSQLAG